MSKYTVTVEIPDGDACGECPLFDNEYQYCHLFPDIPKSDDFKIPQCPSLKIEAQNEEAHL